ncbi:hypothetical protein M0R04_16210 [Candidatus Dojkabacteria bacterium]|jgi:hypothetical protein|nr:hypothetical protein [Candidatus Dojkabacteria bacterium]
MKSTEFLNMVQPSFAQRIYHIYNNIYVLQKCPTCNNTLKFLGFSKGYRKYCTKACIDWKEHYKNISKSVYEKYGVYNISSAEFIKNKKQETCRSHYGVDYPVQCEKVKNKTIETNIKKYGTNWVFQSESFKIKSNNTNLIRYGNECNSKSDICKETYQNNRLDKLKSNWHQIVEDFESFGYKLVSTPENYRWNTIELICPKGHHHITSKSNWNRGVRCGKCANNSTSNAEREVGDFLKNYKIDIIENNRNIIPPYELDIFMLSHNIAIEYNGLYWHKFKNDDYHITKTDLCNSKGIQLIHIFEDEWLYKRDIVKSMILSKLGIS